jgi:hypothetical protein
MKFEIITGVMLTLLLIGMFTVAFNVQATANVASPASAELTDSFVLEFDFSPPVVTEGHVYDSVTMSELSQYGAPGEPVLPFKTAKVLIPQGKDVRSIDVTTGNRKVLEGRFNVEYGKTPIPFSSNATVEDWPNQTIYSSANPFPGVLFSQMSEQYLRGYKILLLELHPVQYIPKTGELFYFETMTVTISLKETGIFSSFFRNLPQDRELLLGIVDNPDQAQTYAKTVTRVQKTTLVDPSHSYNYVIITNNALKSAFQPLVDWKIQKGLNATIVLVEDIMKNPDYHCDGLFGDGLGSPKFNDTQAHIRNFIKDAYLNWGTEYVLLGGDDEIIPSRGVYDYGYGSYTDYNIPCDMYYGTLDGSWDKNNDTIFGEGVYYFKGPENGTAGEEADFFAEVYIGRATVDTPQEAANFVSKTLAYEQNPQVNYLKKALMIGEKLDSITEGGNGKDRVTDIIPQYTTTRLYDRDGTFNRIAVLNELNSEPHIVNHDGHASYTSVMGLSITDVDSLTNTEYFMVYSIGCYSAAFDEATSGPNEAIAEHFIFDPHGAFAYIGNSRYGWYSPGSTEGAGERYDRSFFRVLNSGVRNLGKALQLSKEQEPRLDRWTYFTLNLLGDPETEIVTAIKAPTAHFETRTDLLTPPRIGGLVNLQGTAKRGTAVDATFSNYTIKFGKGTNPTYWMTTGINLANNGESGVVNGTLATWNTSQVTAGIYTLKLSVFDVNGLVGEDRWIVLVATGWAKERVAYSDTYADAYGSRTSIATDSFGNLFIASDYLNWTTGYYEVQVSESSDSGNSWTVIKRAYDSTHNLRFPSIAIDPYRNDIFVAVEREWTSNDHDIFVLRYVDGVWSWSPVANVLGSDDRFPSITSEYSYGGANWQYVSYEYVYSYNDRDLMFAKSTDHGASWSVKKLHGNWPDYNVHAQTSITNAEGYIYIAYKWGADYDSPCEIRVDRSTDFGNTWTQFKDIDGLPNGCSFPSIAATHGGSTVMVAFQYQWSASDIDVWYSYSADNGTTWTKGLGLFISGAENETLPAITVNGGGMTQNDIMGYFHAVCQSDHYIEYKKAYYSSLPSWSQLQIANERWIYSGLAITTQFRNGTGQFYPSVTWIDNRPQSYQQDDIGYTLYYSTPGADIYFNSNPPGRTLEIDGNAYITPVKFNWIAGYNHTMNAPSPQYVGSDTRFVWTGWSDSSTQTHKITAGTLDMTLSAYFKTQYLLTINDNGLLTSESISVESPHPYPNNYNNTWTLTRSGALRMRCHFVYIRTESHYDYVYVLDSSGNIYSIYTGDFDDMWSVWVLGDTIKIRLTSDFSIVDDGFVIDCLEWQSQPVTATIDSVRYELPKSFWWDNGSSHSVSVPLTIDDLTLAGKRYAFTEWSGLSSLPSNNITFTLSTHGILTANYNTQYYLTINTDPGGLTPQPNISPPGPWYDDGTLLTCTAQTVNGYTFDHWTVDETNQGQDINPIGITMNEPHAAIAHYLAHNIAVTNVIPSKTVLGQNYSLSIHVIVQNQGDTTETFNVTAYANTTIIATLTSITLPSRNSTTITFTWNTAGVPGGKYTISAYATPVPGETDLGDNTYMGGWVEVRLRGFVIPPSPTHTKVSLVDFGKLKLIYSQVYPYKCPPYNVTIMETYYNLPSVITGKPEYLMPDINGDGVVTFADVGKLKLIYSGHPPP